MITERPECTVPCQLGNGGNNGAMVVCVPRGPRPGRETDSQSIGHSKSTCPVETVSAWENQGRPPGGRAIGAGPWSLDGCFPDGEKIKGVTAKRTASQHVELRGRGSQGMCGRMGQRGWVCVHPDCPGGTMWQGRWVGVLWKCRAWGTGLTWQQTAL